jgi:hypothetical protein
MIIGVPALPQHSFIDAAWKLIELRPCPFEPRACV